MNCVDKGCRQKILPLFGDVRGHLLVNTSPKQNLLGKLLRFGDVRGHVIIYFFYAWPEVCLINFVLAKLVAKPLLLMNCVDKGCRV